MDWLLYDNGFRHERVNARILTFPLSPRISEGCIKTNYIFIFTLLSRASKGFMKALKAFIKRFATPQKV